MPNHTLRLCPADPANAAEVLAFELENRAYFESILAGRGDAYYHLEHVAATLAQAQERAAAGLEYHVLAWYDEELVGRLALRNIERNTYCRATLGYRFGQRHSGKGLATAATRQLCELALGELGLHRIEALTGLNNLASQAVLRKSGFTQFGHAHAAFRHGGHWQDLLYFERLAANHPE